MLNIPSITHSNLVHVLNDDVPIFDELCQRSLLFIFNCFFHSSSCDLFLDMDLCSVNINLV